MSPPGEVAPDPRAEGVRIGVTLLLGLAWVWLWRRHLAGLLADLLPGDAPGAPELPDAVWGPLGTDAALWGLTAADLRVGAEPLVPPLYPGLVALVEGTLSLGLPDSGVLPSLLAAGCLPAALAWLARGLGAAWPEALGAAALLALSPDLLAWSQQLQPEALTALLLTLLAGALARAGRSRGLTAVAVALGALLPLLREHGLLLAPLAALGLALARPGGWRAGVALLVLAAALPVVGGWGQWPPLTGPWSDRAGGALAALTSRDPGELGFLNELRRPERSAYLALVAEGDLVGRLAWHARRSLALAADAWSLLAVAMVLGLLWWRRQPRVAAVLILLPAALPALLIWSQRRHVALLLPLGLALLAAGSRVLRRPTLPGPGWQRLGVGLGLALALCWSWPGRLPDLARAQLSESAHARAQARLSRALCAEAGPGELLGTRHQELGLGCPLPRHDPDGSLADWRTWVVAEAAPAAPGTWSRVDSLEGELGIWRLEPERRERPCAEVELPRGAGHIAVERGRVELVCTVVDPRSTPE